MSSFSNIAWLRTYMHFDSFSWGIIMLAVYAVWCVLRAGLCLHKEARVGLCVLFGSSSCYCFETVCLTELELAGVYRHLQTCLAFYVSAGDLNSGAHDCRASTLTLWPRSPVVLDQILFFTCLAIWCKQGYLHCLPAGIVDLYFPFLCVSPPPHGLDLF